MSMRAAMGDKSRPVAWAATSGLFVALVLVAAVGLLAGCGAGGPAATGSDATAGQATPSSVSGDAAPDFAGVTLDGSGVSLGEYRGKPLVLAFMASW